MKILVFSDSHGNIKNMQNAMDNFKDINTIIHLGDFMDDIKKVDSDGYDIYYVSGNNDFTTYPNEKLITLQNYKFFITHGNKYGVYDSVLQLYYKGISEEADIILFGHTHKMFLERTDKCLMLNPGSISNPRDIKQPTFAILEILDNKIDATFFKIEEDKIIKL